MGTTRHSDVEISLEGTWKKGGVLKIRKGEREHRFGLSQPLFVVMALLMMLAKKADGEATEGLSVDELRQQITRKTRLTGRALDPEPEHVIRYIYRLRQHLAKIGGRDWSQEILEWVFPVGYRLTIDPDQLHLHLQQDLSDPDALEDSSSSP